MFNLTLNKIPFYTTLLLASFPLWEPKLISVLIVFWLVSTIVFGILHYKTNKLGSLKPLLIQSSLFIVIFTWTIFIDKSKEAHFYLERSLSLIIFPVGFYFNPISFSQKQLNSIKAVFSIATLLIILYGTISSAIMLLQFVGPKTPFHTISDLLNYTEFQFYFRRFFEQYSRLHPTYASMYIGVSILFALELFIANINNWSKKILITISLFILVQLFFMAALASRTPFAATLLIALLLIFIKLKKKIHFLYALAFTIVLVVILFLSVPSFSARLSQISIHNTEVPSKAGKGDSFNVRSGILHCSVELIKENWLIGVGPGNVQDNLDNCYMEIAPQIYDGFHFNTHNQYLGYWAAMGICGIAALLLILVSSIVKGIKTNQLLFVLICLLFAICFLTENIMVRQQGIVAVALFINLFYFLGDKVLNKESTYK